MNGCGRFASSYYTGIQEIASLESLSETYSRRRNSCVRASATSDSRADYVFLKILAPGLSEAFPLDAKPALSDYMSTALKELSAPVEGLSIGGVATGSMDLLIQSLDDTQWASAHELRLVADAYTVGMSQLELAGDFRGGALQSAFDAASAASAHGRTSDRPLNRAFWRHPGLLAYGTVAPIKTGDVIPSTREASSCAALCVNDLECTTFAFSFLERLCFLLSDAQLTLCDPEVSTSCSTKSNALLDQLSVISRCRYCVFYQEDASSLYCASTSNRCATLREYNQCLDKNTCGESDKDFQVLCVDVQRCVPAVLYVPVPVLLLVTIVC